jgi:hypothetical protein
MCGMIVLVNMDVQVPGVAYILPRSFKGGNLLVRETVTSSMHVAIGRVHQGQHLSRYRCRCSESGNLANLIL